jgi:2-dehydropantoate 2-reductase
MKIAILGAGGIGGLYGGLLARAGEDVTFVARGEQLDALRREGLTVVRDHETFTVRPVSATGDPAAAGAAALVLLTVKTYQLETALASLPPLLGPETVVLPLLNGVDIQERVAARVGAGRVLAGLTYMPANRPRPGVVHQPGPARRMVFGEPAGGPSPRVRTLETVFRRAGLEAEASGEMPRELWHKFMLVTCNGGVCGVTAAPIGRVMTDADTRALYRDCALEVEAVARARGVALPGDAVEETLAHADTTPPANRPSLLQDLEAGRPLELESLNGAMARFGRALGVAVPVNTFIYGALKQRAAGRELPPCAGAGEGEQPPAGRGGR